MKKTSFVLKLITILGLSSSLYGQDCSYIKSLDSFEKKDLHCVTEFMVKNFDKKLPMRIDNITSLNKIVNRKNKITYKYIFNTPKMSSIEYKRVERIQKGIVLKDNCLTPYSRKLIDEGIVFGHSYYDTKSILRMNFSINKKSCRKKGY